MMATTTCNLSVPRRPCGRDRFLLCLPDSNLFHLSLCHSALFPSLDVFSRFLDVCAAIGFCCGRRHSLLEQKTLAFSTTTMYKRLATAALAGVASAAVAPYPSISVCTETSTLIFRSTTEYSTYEITHTLGESGYPAPTGSAPPYGSGSSSAPHPTGGYGSSSAVQPTGGYGSASSSVGAPTGSYPPDTTVTDVTTIYTTTCPAESTYTSGSETLTSTYTTVSTLTSTYQSTITAPGGYGSATTYPNSPATTVTDVTTVYTTTCPASSVYTSESSEMTSYYTTVSTLTSTYQSTITAYPPPPASSPSSPETTGPAPAPPAPYSPPAESSPTSPETTGPVPAPPAPYSPPAESSPASPESTTEVAPVPLPSPIGPETTGEAPPAPYSSPAGSSPASPETTGAAPPAPAPYSSAPGAPAPASSSAAGGIGSWIISPSPYSSPASPVATSLPPVVPYPVPSGNATYPTLSTGMPSAASSGYPVEQTGNAGVMNKPFGAVLGLAGLFAALL